MAKNMVVGTETLETHTFTDFVMEDGSTVTITVGYTTYGTLAADASNIVVVPTWFMGRAVEKQAFGILGSGLMYNPDDYYVIVLESLGNGISTNLGDAQTIGDMVQAHYRVVTEILGVSHVLAVSGISMGGLQTFEWSLAYPDFMDKIVPIVGGPRLSPTTVFNHQIEVDMITAVKGTAADVELMKRALGAMQFRNISGNPSLRGQLTDNATAAKTADEWKDLAFGDGGLAEYKTQLLASMNFNAYGGRADGTAAGVAALVQAEVLSITATNDEWADELPQIEFTEAITGAELVKLDAGCGHLDFICSLETLAPQVNAFLAK